MPIINSFSLMGCHHRQTENSGEERRGWKEKVRCVCEGRLTENTERSRERLKEEKLEKRKTDGNTVICITACVTGVRDALLNANPHPPSKRNNVKALKHNHACGWNYNTS